MQQPKIIMSISDILNEIKSSNSRNHKDAVFIKHKDNELFKRVCKMAYDPLINYYVLKIPQYEPTTVTGISLDGGLNEIERLASREFTGHRAIDHLASVLSMLDPSDADVLKRVIKGDLDVGASDGTVENTWPGLLSSWPMALSSPFKYPLLEALIEKPGRKFSQKKSDGARTNIIIRGGNVQLRSRSGRLIETYGRFDWLAEELDNVMIDGELLARDVETGKPMPRKTGNGLVTKAVKGKLPKSEADILYLSAWDIVPIEEFDARQGTQPYEQRFDILTSGIKQILRRNPAANIELIPSEEITTIEEAVESGQRYIAQGDEGVIIKHGSILWGDERSKLSVKIKGERECDLRVVDVLPGDAGTKYESMVGRLICESEDGLLRVSVGGGLNDPDRAQPFDYWRNSIIGVLYNEKIKSKKRKSGEPEYSLFLPRMHPAKRKRIDKNVADTLENIE